jgi:hypothetical protein
LGRDEETEAEVRAIAEGQRARRGSADVGTDEVPNSYLVAACRLCEITCTQDAVAERAATIRIALTLRAVNRDDPTL